MAAKTVFSTTIGSETDHAQEVVSLEATNDLKKADENNIYTKRTRKFTMTATKNATKRRG